MNPQGGPPLAQPPGEAEAPSPVPIKGAGKPAAAPKGQSKPKKDKKKDATQDEPVNIEEGEEEDYGLIDAPEGVALEGTKEFSVTVRDLPILAPASAAADNPDDYDFDGPDPAPATTAGALASSTPAALVSLAPGNQHQAPPAAAAGGPSSAFAARAQGAPAAPLPVARRLETAVIKQGQGLSAADRRAYSAIMGPNNIPNFTMLTTSFSNRREGRYRFKSRARAQRPQGEEEEEEEDDDDLVEEEDEAVGEDGAAGLAEAEDAQGTEGVPVVGPGILSALHAPPPLPPPQWSSDDEEEHGDGDEGGPESGGNGAGVGALGQSTAASSERRARSGGEGPSAGGTGGADRQIPGPAAGATAREKNAMAAPLEKELEYEFTPLAQVEWDKGILWDGAGDDDGDDSDGGGAVLAAATTAAAVAAPAPLAAAGAPTPDFAATVDPLAPGTGLLSMELGSDEEPEEGEVLFAAAHGAGPAGGVLGGGGAGGSGGEMAQTVGGQGEGRAAAERAAQGAGSHPNAPGYNARSTFQWGAGLSSTSWGTSAAAKPAAPADPLAMGAFPPATPPGQQLQLTILPRRNQQLASCSWLDDVHWGGGSAHTQVASLVFDLNDPQMTFVLRPEAPEAARKAVELASALLVDPRVAATVAPATSVVALSPAEMLKAMNISLDDVYCDKQAAAAAGAPGMVSRMSPLQILHSLPALQFETVAPFLKDSAASDDKEEGRALTNFHRPRAALVPPKNPQKFPENKEDMTIVVCSLTSGGLHIQLGPLQKSSNAEKLRNAISNHPEVAQEMSRDFWDDRTTVVPGKQSKDDNVVPKPLSFAKGANLNACRHMGRVYLLSTRVQLFREGDTIPQVADGMPLYPPAAFKTPRELSADTGSVYLVEYHEQYPLLLSNRGMGAKLVTWRRGDAGETAYAPLPAAKGSEVIELQPGQPAPFLFDVPQGGKQLSLETRMFRSPLFEHPPQASDFLLIRTHCGKWKLRRITSTAIAGHEEPFPEGSVPAPCSVPPQTPSAHELLSNRIKAYVFRDLLRKIRSKEAPVVSMKELVGVFTGVPSQTIRDAISDFMSFDRAARGEKPDRAQLRPGYPIDLNEIMQLCTPEMVCCYESMQAAERRMFLFGLENPAKFINPKTSLATALKAVQKNRGETEAIKLAATAIQLELQLAPWAQTHAFLEAIRPENKLFLALDAGAGGTGLKRRGLIFHYAKKPPKKNQEKDRPGPRAHERITGTSADLRTLKKAETKALLLSYNFTEAEIEKIKRWKRIDLIRKCNAAAMADKRIGENKWLRQTRETQQESAENQRKSANALYARMSRLLAFGVMDVVVAPEIVEAKSDDDDDDGFDDWGADLERRMAENAGLVMNEAAPLAARADEPPAETAEDFEAFREVLGTSTKRSDPDRPGKVLFLLGKCTRGNEVVRTKVVAKEVYEAYFAAKAEGKRDDDLHDAIRKGIEEFEINHPGKRATVQLRDKVVDQKAKDREIKTLKRQIEAAEKKKELARAEGAKGLTVKKGEMIKVTTGEQGGLKMSINFKSKAKVLALKAGGGGGAPVLKAKKAGAKPRAPAPPPPVVDAATAEGLADLDDAGGTPARAPRGMEDIGGLATAHAAPAAQKAPRENALPKVTPPRPPERAGGSKKRPAPASAERPNKSKRSKVSKIESEEEDEEHGSDDHSEEEEGQPSEEEDEEETPVEEQKVDKAVRPKGAPAASGPLPMFNQVLKGILTPFLKRPEFQPFHKTVTTKADGSKPDLLVIHDYMKVIGTTFTMSVNQAKIRAAATAVSDLPITRTGMFRDLHEFLDTIDLIAIYARIYHDPNLRPKSAFGDSAFIPVAEALVAEVHEAVEAQRDTLEGYLREHYGLASWDPSLRKAVVELSPQAAEMKAIRDSMSPEERLLEPRKIALAQEPPQRQAPRAPAVAPSQSKKAKHSHPAPPPSHMGGGSGVAASGGAARALPRATPPLAAAVSVPPASTGVKFKLKFGGGSGAKPEGAPPRSAPPVLDPAPAEAPPAALPAAGSQKPVIRFKIKPPTAPPPVAPELAAAASLSAPLPADMQPVTADELEPPSTVDPAELAAMTDSFFNNDVEGE